MFLSEEGGELGRLGMGAENGVLEEGKGREEKFEIDEVLDTLNLIRDAGPEDKLWVLSNNESCGCGFLSGCPGLLDSLRNANLGPNPWTDLQVSDS